MEPGLVTMATTPSAVGIVGILRRSPPEVSMRMGDPLLLDDAATFTNANGKMWNDTIPSIRNAATTNDRDDRTNIVYCIFSLDEWIDDVSVLALSVPL